MSDRVVVAMSGGVDSSVVAALLQEQGYEVIGATLATGVGGDALKDAAAVCAAMGIPHHILDVRDDFERRVTGPFCAAYLAGQTPNPCVICNPALKFPAFLPLLQETNSNYLATGHYVRIKHNSDGRSLLYRAVDHQKDQSYFLYALPQDLLARCLFPLGEYEKPQVREKARTLGLTVAEKGDSQDICFIPDGDYRAYLASRTEKQPLPGEMVDAAGQVLGRHSGLANYTIGQRKGLGLALGYPAYVIGMDQAANRLIIGPEEQLYQQEAFCKQLRFLPYDAVTSPLICQVKIRYRTPAAAAKLVPQGDGMRIVFDQPQRAITPGQAAVFYDGELLVGGGTLVNAVCG